MRGHGTDSPDGRRQLALKILLAVVLAAGSVAAFRFVSADPSARSVYNLDADSATYDALARQVLKTGSLRLIPCLWPPGFIVWLSAIYGLFGPSYLAAKLVSWGLLTLMALVAGIAMWQRAGPAEGVIAAGATIASPILVAYAATLQYEMLAAFLTTVIVALLLIRPSRAWPQVFQAVVLAGLCACAAFVREVLVLIFPLCLIAIIQRTRRVSLPRTAQIAVLMTAVFSGIVASWSVVQYQQTGRLVVLSDKSDLNVRIGNNPRANGTYNVQLNSIGEPGGWAFVRAFPWRAARLGVRKILFFWGVLRDPWTVPQSSSVVVSRATLNVLPLQYAEAATNGAVLLLFIAGAIMIRRRPALWPLPAIVVLTMAVHALYFGAQRFAVPVDGLVYMTVALPVAAAARWALRSRARMFAIGGAVVWVVAAQFLSFGGRYHVEAEDLEGISAENLPDAIAANGIARFAPAAAGARPIAFISGAYWPEGAFRIRVQARAADCSHPDEPALTISLRDEHRVPKQNVPFRVADLCGTPGYHAVGSLGSLHRDELVYLYVLTEGTADMFVDAIDVDVGYRRRADLAAR